jgi:hypothetical protein
MGLKSVNKLRILAMFLFLSACGIADSGKVTAKDVLKHNPDADIFQYEGFIYSNVTELEWFEERKESLAKEKLIGEVKIQSTRSFGFKDFTATKLPVGTKIYSSSQGGKESGVLILEIEGEDLFYMVMLEG